MWRLLVQLMPVIGTLTRFTEPFVFYSIEFFPDIRTFHAGVAAQNIPPLEYTRV